MPIWKRKTFWGAVVGMVTATGAYLSGELTLALYIGAMIAAVQTIFIRQAIDKPPGE